LAETAVLVLREGRMVRHIAIEAKAAKLAVCQIEGSSAAPSECRSSSP
jgi:hypothetical protein